MPNNQSAKKRVRQSAKRRDANRQKKSGARTYEKKLRKAVEENRIEDAQAAYRTFTSLIDRAAKRNIVHKNTAARKKSRLNSLVKKAVFAAKETAPAAVAE